MGCVRAVAYPAPLPRLAPPAPTPRKKAEGGATKGPEMGAEGGMEGAGVGGPSAVSEFYCGGESKPGGGEFKLTIGKWQKEIAEAPSDALYFLVSPATLTFNEVTDLKISIDYAGVAMGPFSIAGIDRQVKTYPNGFTKCSWRIPINFPPGEMSFVASGFTQSLRCAPMETPEQHLTWEQRSRAAV